MRKQTTRKAAAAATYAVHIDAKRVRRLRRIARRQLIEPSIAELVRIALDFGMAELEQR